MADQNELERLKRGVLRKITNNKRCLANALAQNPSTELVDKIGAYIKAWQDNMTALEGFDNQLLALIDETKLTASQLTKAEEAITKDYITYETELSEAIGKHATMLRLVNAQVNPPRSRQSAVNASFLEATLTSPTVKIQDMPVPKFDGKQQNFPDWYAEFKSMIHDNEGLDNFQRMYLLKRAMTGAAETLLKDYGTEGDVYPHALEYVRARYYNKRAIIAGHFADLLDLPPMKVPTLRENVDKIQRIVRGLTVCGLDTAKMSPLIAFIVSRKLPEKLRMDWENSNHDYSTYPSFEPMATFLNNRCFAYETTATIDSMSAKQSKPSAPAKSTASTFTPDSKPKTTLVTSKEKPSSSPKCYICQKEHYTSSCPTLLEKNINDRYQLVTSKRLCTNCLRYGHKYNECRSTKCRTCGRLHHTLLHRDNNLVSLPSTSAGLPVSNVDSTPKVALALSAPKQSVVLLPSAIVHVRLGTKHIPARALLDHCSQANLVSEKFVRENRLRTAPVTSMIASVSPQASVSDAEVALCIKSRVNDYQLQFNASVVGRIPYEINPRVVQYIESVQPNLRLADVGYLSSTVDLLIGGEFVNRILLGNKQFIAELCFEESQFGWVVSGPINTNAQIDTRFCNLTVAVQDQLARFWEVEEVAPPNSTLSEHELCEAHFESTYSRLPDGQFQVRLPFKEDPSKLARTFNQAKAQLIKHEQKLDESTRKMYVDFMREYIKLGHMTLVDPITTTDRYFIPHLPVIRLESTTTKLRVVFNASARNSTGISLNQALMVGPTLQPDLFDVLMKLRLHRVAFGSDISMMYRRIIVHPEDRKFQCILWREHSNEPIRIYELNTLTYGTSPASYIAVKCVRKVTEDIAKTHPEITKAILDEWYMDDWLSGANSVEEALFKQSSVHEALQAANFPLRKYVSNSREFLNSLDPDIVEELRPVSFSAHGAAKVLGLQWQPVEDILRVKVNVLDISNVTITKRIVCSLIAGIFDPLGIVTPVTIRGKIILQDLWREELGWDDPIPSHLDPKFRQLYNDLEQLPLFSVPRSLHNPNMVGIPEIGLVGFADASTLAYGATIYSRSIVDGQSYSLIVCSKTKVAPVKTITIPRLELLATVLLNKLLSRVSKLLSYDLNSAKVYSDSTVALAWLKGPSSRYDTFVRNRIDFVTATLPFNQWSYVNTHENPADLCTRGISVTSLINNLLWLYGPTDIIHNAPHLNIALPLDPPEIHHKATAVLLHSTGDVPVEYTETIIARYSDLNKLLRVTVCMLTFISRARSSKKAAVITRDDALHTLCRVSQRVWFDAEYVKLQNDHSLPPRSSLTALNPFLKNSVLRVGGRLQHSSLEYNAKHPIILHHKSVLANLLAQYIHKKYFHATRAFVISFIRQRYWIVGGVTKLVKAVIRNCIWCTRMKAETVQQMMGELPPDRTLVSRPFAVTGVDFAGPFTIRCTNHRSSKHLKHYAVCFVCMTTRAVHIESVSDLTTEAFIGALQRFTARRGVPHTVWSDNATNFVGTRNILLAHALETGISWKFIPPRSPHHGGIWEAAVKSAKKHLLAVTRDSVFNEDQFKTVLTSIEAILNSRPLYARPSASDADVIDLITPGHFLVGSHLLQPPVPELTVIDLRDRLNAHRQIIRSFWTRWKSDYLANLQLRTRWKRSLPNLEVGDIVIIKQDVSPASWPLARISRVFCDKNNRVRTVMVKTANSEFLRSVQQLVKLPVSMEPSISKTQGSSGGGCSA